MSGLKLPSLVSALIALAVAAAIPAAAGAAQASPLSPRLVVLSSPQVRSLGPARQSRRVGLTPSGTGSLLRRGNRVVVEVRFAEGAATSTEALKAAGAQVIAVSPEYQTATAAVVPAHLRQVAAVPDVIGVQEVITPFTSATSTNCPQGAVVSEGDRQLEAARARNDFGVDGSGVTVGILSDSFNQWKGAPASEAGDVSTGDLPGPGNPCGFERPVKVVTPFIPGAYPEPGEEPENPPEPGEESADEGRGMAQIVHDLAPGADLDFASAFNGELAFAKGIKDLYDEGARVIADDVAYFNEPFFQDGPIADAVNEVVAGGASYFSSAGNDNLMDEKGRDIGSIEAPKFRPMGCPAALPAEYTTCMNFNPEVGKEDDTWGVTLEEGAPLYLDLQWAQPWHGVTTDLDMFVLNERGELAGRAFNTANTEPNRQQPYEFIPYEAGIEEGAKEEEMQVVIARCDVACGAVRAEEEVEPGVKPNAGTKGGDEGTPRLKVAIFNNGGGVTASEYPESKDGDVVGPTLFGHTAAASAISVAAINIGTSEEPEAYSSRGPVVHLFGPVSGTAPAPPIGERVIAKPNVTASDCGSTTFFYGFREGRFRFCGTSAAAPHAAAVAALIRSANPGATNVQVRADLEATARPVGSNALGFYGPDAIGAGLVDADSAVAALALPPTVTITTPPAASSDQRQPSIVFAANRPASFTCSLDGASATPCTSPYVLPVPLADGNHEFKVTATDVAGRSGSATAQFTIAPVAPTVPVATFVRHPRKVVKTRKGSVRLSFGLKSSVPGSTFRCKIDNKGKFKPCKASFSASFRIGRHVVAAKAVGPTGTVGKAATFQFRVVKVTKHHRKHHRGRR
ncbi:MAG: S8 family serine peptidase [Actinobacteria bacterium]|nr:S8 family serine peptidase [Actinomycetota bacterium]